MGWFKGALGVARLMFDMDVEKNRQALWQEDRVLRERQERRLQRESEAEYGRIAPMPKQISLGKPGERKGVATGTSLKRRFVPGLAQQRLAEMKRGRDLQERAVKITEMNFMKDLDAIKKSDQQVRPKEVLNAALDMEDMDKRNKSQVSKHFAPLFNYAKDLVAQRQQAGEGQAQGITRYELFQGMQTILQDIKPRVLEGLEKDIKKGRLEGRNMDELQELYDEVTTDTFLLNEMPNAARRAEFERRLEEIESLKAEGRLGPEFVTATPGTQLIRRRPGREGGEVGEVALTVPEPRKTIKAAPGTRLIKVGGGTAPEQIMRVPERQPRTQELTSIRQDKTALRKEIAQIRKLPDLDVYQEQKARLPLLEDELQDLIAREKELLGKPSGKAKTSTAYKTAEDVKAAYKAKKITKAKAAEILRDQFGME